MDELKYKKAPAAFGDLSTHHAMLVPLTPVRALHRCPSQCPRLHICRHSGVDKEYGCDRLRSLLEHVMVLDFGM